MQIEFMQFFPFPEEKHFLLGILWIFLFRDLNKKAEAAQLNHSSQIYEKSIEVKFRFTRDKAAGRGRSPKSSSTHLSLSLLPEKLVSPRRAS